MSEASARHGLPLIQPGQAQKELAHNEALATLDLLIHPAVAGLAIDAPPTEPQVGQCWLVGPEPTGVWSGHANTLAGWTTGGWRFVEPAPGMIVWIDAASGYARWTGSAWAVGIVPGTSLRIGGQQVVGPRAAAIPDPAGGATPDPEARNILTQILSALRQHGLISP